MERRGSDPSLPTRGELDALARMVEENDRRVSSLQDEIDTVRGELDSVRTELFETVQRAGRALAGDASFMKPYSQDLADHMAEHAFGKAGKKVLFFLVAAILTWVLVMATKGGAFGK